MELFACSLLSAGCAPAGKAGMDRRLNRSKQEVEYAEQEEH